MPAYAYCGTVPRAYPETRVGAGVITGTVSYGDVRDYAEPPDADWFPAGGPLPARLPPGPEAADVLEAAGDVLEDERGGGIGASAPETTETPDGEKDEG